MRAVPFGEGQPPYLARHTEQGWTDQEVEGIKMTKLTVSAALLLALMTLVCQAQMPGAVKGSCDRARTLCSEGNFDEAISEYNKAIELKPNVAEAYQGRGEAWFRKGNASQAIADYSTAISIDPDFALAYFSRGYARKMQGNTKGALADFDKAIDADPNYGLAFAYRGLTRLSLGKEAQARKDFDRGLKLDPSIKPLLVEYAAKSVEPKDL